MAVDYYTYDPKEHKVVEQGKEEEEEEEDDYIDMEVSSFTQFFALSNNLSPPHHAREFEFHMSSNNVEKESTTSPADELFYKGKLLPLHLPPRLQMVEKLLQDSIPSPHLNRFDEFYSTPLGTNTATTPTTSTPFESCSVTPVESCHVSRELNPDEYFRDFASQDDQKGFLSSGNPKKSWTKKLKIKIKSLFGSKSGCSDESLASNNSAVRNKEELGSSSKGGEHLDEDIKGTKKNTLGQISRRENEAKEDNVSHRRSFSGAFKRRSSITKMSSSSSSGSSSSSSSSSSSNASSNSNGLHDQQPLKRSNSAKLEIESSLIQGAIAHCKQSQQAIRSRKTLSEVGFHSFSSSRLSAFDDQTGPSGLCRG